tara:strand:+ start:32 stop:1513 length:1482 start_codon:yes stop_codon:yes gene_type:complete
MPSSVNANAVENVANDTASLSGGAFRSLSYYLAKNEVALYPKWNVYDQLFGSIKWEPNMGSTLNGTTPTPSPIQNITFMPNTLDSYPKKDQFQVGERYEEAQLGMHRFESNRFRFLNNFESFWRDHLSYAQSDIVRQIQCANNIFIRTLMYYQAPDAYLSGKGLSSQVVHATNTRKRAFSQSDIRKITNVTGGGGGADTSTDEITVGGVAQTNQTIAKSGGKDFRADVSHGGTGTAIVGKLTLKELFKAMLVLQEDIQAPTFDRIYNVPKQSEMPKGKYVLICSTEAWSSLLWDDSLRTNGAVGTAANPSENLIRTTTLAPANMNLLQDGFAGDLFGKITAKFDPYPMRFTKDGSLVTPQSVDSTTGKVTPNANYTKIDTTNTAVASYEIAFLVGADAFKTIQVGPPPKEFASKNMSAKKFYSMKWNGEVHLTDQFLIPDGGGSAPLTDNLTGGSELNVYGDYLKFISQAVFGGIPGDARYCLPIIFERSRTS